MSKTRQREITRMAEAHKMYRKGWLEAYNFARDLRTTGDVHPESMAWRKGWSEKGGVKFWGTGNTFKNLRRAADVALRLMCLPKADGRKHANNIRT